MRIAYDNRLLLNACAPTLAARLVAVARLSGCTPCGESCRGIGTSKLEANTLNTAPAQATGANQTSTLSTHPAFSASLAKLASKLFFASCFQVAASN